MSLLRQFRRTFIKGGEQKVPHEGLAQHEVVPLSMPGRGRHVVLVSQLVVGLVHIPAGELFLRFKLRH